jgi:hypothetical protein
MKRVILLIPIFKTNVEGVLYLEMQQTMCIVVNNGLQAGCGAASTDAERYLAAKD